ncbi:MAG: YqiA/YcfP family alpha/beta fold hydrolase [Campylobacterota bacterium]|nr:YqiA/YcfP family alpha/beta fold hydrolase [Campylobacterota bacterium]
MIIYIHGFGSSGRGMKAKILKEEFKDEHFIAPSLSYVPELAIETLKELITAFSKTEKVYLIGSSLGGYYSIYLADYFNIPAVLINPSTKPTVTLKKVLGNPNNFYDGASYEWNENHLKMLEQYEVKTIKPELYMLLTQKGDETLDYKEALNKLKGCKTFLEDGGSHSFENIQKDVQNIRAFFR